MAYAGTVENSIPNILDATKVAEMMPKMVIHLMVTNTLSHILIAASSGLCSGSSSPAGKLLSRLPISTITARIVS